MAHLGLTVTRTPAGLFQLRKVSTQQGLRRCGSRMESRHLLALRKREKGPDPPPVTGKPSTVRNNDDLGPLEPSPWQAENSSSVVLKRIHGVIRVCISIVPAIFWWDLRLWSCWMPASVSDNAGIYVMYIQILLMRFYSGFLKEFWRPVCELFVVLLEEEPDIVHSGMVHVPEFVVVPLQRQFQEKHSHLEWSCCFAKRKPFKQQ